MNETIRKLHTAVKAAEMLGQWGLADAYRRIMNKLLDEQQKSEQDDVSGGIL